MQWDIGLQGIAVLAGLSLLFGGLAQLAFWSRETWWVWIVAAVAFFALGAFISEVMFGWATATDLQPNIDGLSFDEVLLGYVVGVPVVLIVRWLAGRQGPRPIHR